MLNDLKHGTCKHCGEKVTDGHWYSSDALGLTMRCQTMPYSFHQVDEEG